MMAGPRLKSTWKTKIFLWLYNHFPRLDQWFLNRCDAYPCESCIHFDSYGCGWLFVDPKCNYEHLSSGETADKVSEND